MNRFAQSRAALVAALDEVAPGRTFAYRTDKVVPAVWLGVALPGERTPTGGRTPVKVARFPVTITFDGSDDAQVAGLDELTAKVTDAIQALPGARVVGARTSEETVAGRAYQAVVLDVSYSLGIGSFCGPTVTAAEIPPPIVERIA